MPSVRWLCHGALCLGCIGCGYSDPGLDEAATALVEAKQALAAGDSGQAMDLLDASIESRPDPWAYLERAKLHAENDDDVAAQSDVEAGLELDPQHSDLLWLQKELKKPKTSRFKGRRMNPPSHSK